MITRSDLHCKRSGCRCSHTEGCDRGWMEVPAGAMPCPVCRPDRQQYPNESREEWHERLRARNAAAERGAL